MNPQTCFPNAPDPLAAQLAIINLLLAMMVLRLEGGGGGLHCQGAMLICYVSQGHGPSGLTGPWRREVSASLEALSHSILLAWTEAPNGSRPRAMDGYDMFTPRAISIIWNFDG